MEYDKPKRFNEDVLKQILRKDFLRLRLPNLILTFSSQANAK